jgi:hypothetical protein
MIFELGLVAFFIILLLIISVIAFFIWGIKHAIVLAINSVIGFFALYAIQAFWRPDLVINFWSVGLVAIFGIFGFLFVLILHLMGWAF